MRKSNLTVYIIDSYILSREALRQRLCCEYNVAGVFGTTGECLKFGQNSPSGCTRGLAENSAQRSNNSTAQGSGGNIRRNLDEGCKQICSKNSAPDIILADIKFQDDEADAIKKLKQKYPKVKIIVLAAFEDREKILKALKEGVCGYVIKDYDTNLIDVIETVAQGGFRMDMEMARMVFSNMQSESEKDDVFALLTSREMEILKLLCEGKTNSQIAQETVISINTAKAHVTSILAKLCAKDRVQAAVMATKAHLYREV